MHRARSPQAQRIQIACSMDLDKNAAIPKKTPGSLSLKSLVIYHGD